MRALSDDYAARLTPALGHSERKRIPYQWQTSIDCVDLDHDVRRRIRSAILAEVGADGLGSPVRRTPDAFGGGAVPLAEWLETPDPTVPTAQVDGHRDLPGDDSQTDRHVEDADAEPGAWQAVPPASAARRSVAAMSERLAASSSHIASGRALEAPSVHRVIAVRLPPRTQVGGKLDRRSVARGAARASVG